ncbi:MAG: cysteine synthase A [Proteobacteria bacterium]|nr:cysteine synthase A [Pseudomonadota bacterium]MDA1356310.1 cysteine synthase A [Pseudomonadota bacterium]
MSVKEDFIELIGNTPMLRLKAASERTGCEILGKCEFLNPGGSVKDRAALFIVRDAEKRGQLKPGGVIVEGTAGNTGIGLTLVGNALGYRSVIVIPDTQSQEKKDMLRLCGAELIEVPAVPYRDPNNFVRYSGRLAEELDAKDPKGAVWANQFDNIANRQAHFETTGPEIWEQTNGRLDGFVCSVGSGGTLAGIALYLKERNANIVIGLADPMGAALFNYYAHGELKAKGSSITEGIGQGRITANLEGVPIDVPFQIPDEEALPIIFDLVVEEGHVLGGSSGINIAGAIRLAEKLGPGHTIVTILADYGMRYMSKMFNPEFLRAKNLPVPQWLETGGNRGGN